MNGAKEGFVSVVLPCFNEKENVLKLVVDIHNVLENYQHEILVVDDNSPDGTYSVLKNENHSYVHPILRTQDKGFAKSIRYGIENSKGEIIVVMDSDFNHQPKYLPFMLENMRFYDCVSASRFLYGGTMESRSRHYFSWMFNVFTRIMTGGMVTDSLYGYYAVKREKLFKEDFNKIFWGYGDYCIRLLFYLQKSNVSILQFPAINGRRYAGEGNSRFFNVFRQYFSAVVKLTIKERF